MEYTIENECLKVTVASHGAELVSVVSKDSGDECIWEGDKAVWGRHAPILFPYTGNQIGKKMTVDGKEYACPQHGFARDMEHAPVKLEKDRLELALTANEETKARFPFDFVLRSIFTLEGNTLHQTLRVENPADGTLRFGIGFHPAFAIPFDGKHDTEDYEFRFDHEESPLVLEKGADGLMSGTVSYFDTNIDRIQLTDHLFDNDSFCFAGLKSHKLGIYEKDSDRSIVVDIEKFPYTLIWSALSEKVRFVCIEPWETVTGPNTGSNAWEKRPCAAALAKGESFETTLTITFNR